MLDYHTCIQTSSKKKVSILFCSTMYHLREKCRNYSLLRSVLDRGDMYADDSRTRWMCEFSVLHRNNFRLDIVIGVCEHTNPNYYYDVIIITRQSCFCRRKVFYLVLVDGDWVWSDDDLDFVPHCLCSRYLSGV